MAARQIVKNLLLVFVFISIGFAAGKEYALRSMRMPQAAAGAAAAGTGDKLIVYYLHGSIRCVTCNTIEKLAREVVQRDFAQEVQAGRMEWRTANYQKEEELGKRYDVASSSVVLVKLEQGKEVAFKRLDEVWRLVDHPADFAAYIGREVDALRGGKP